MKLPKIIAFYFPQFHPIKENSVWWGENFTDWDLVKAAKPLFKGHKQPRKPLNENYYNPSDENTLKSQSELAKKYGIDGFMFYHYWFDGKLLLEKPLETFLLNKNIDFSFCLAWANETWTRAWIGKPEVILQEQSHKNDKRIWNKHFDYLLPFFKDHRYIKVDGKPIFFIYQPFLVKDSKNLISFFNKQAIKNGLPGIYFVAIKNHKFYENNFLKSYDGLLKFQPREAYTSKYFKNENIISRFQFLRKLPDIFQLYLAKFYQRISSYKIFDSKKIWLIILNNSYVNEFKQYKLKIFESAFFEWDNTPRYKNNSKIFTSLKRDDMKKYFKSLVLRAKKNDSPYVFFNAWNEWSETAYLEPDEESGYEKLELIKEVLAEIKNEENISSP